MKMILLLLLQWIAVTGLAQRAGLKQLCAGLENFLSQGDAFHVSYTLTVKGRSEQPETQSMEMNMYKKGNASMIRMGEAQDLFCQSKLMVMINHLQKVIYIQTDTSASLKAQGMLPDLIQLVDSASEVSSREEEKSIVYTLSYPRHYMYRFLELRFSARTHQLERMYGEFDPLYPEPFYSVTIDYHAWDTGWKPESGFPLIDRYVRKEGSKYVAQGTWSGYRVIQQHER